MQCISCGKVLNKDQKICPKCGKNQPLAETENLTKWPGLKSLSPIFLLIGLVMIPLSILGIIALIFISISEKIALYKLIIGLANIIFIAILPFALALIFKQIK